MHVSFVFSSLMLSGGVMLASEYANGLLRRGHRISFVAPSDTLSPEVAVLLDERVQRIETRSGFPTNRSPWALGRLSMELARAIPRSDVVIATHTPTVVPGYLHKRRYPATPLCWLYMDYPVMFEGKRLERTLLNRAPDHVDQILTISQPLTDYVAPTTQTPVVTIGAGLLRQHLFFDQPRIDANEKYGDDHVRILYVGDNRPRKGLRPFLEACDIVLRSHKRIRPVIASKEPCDIQTETPYEFHLAPSHEKLAKLYRSSDLFVSASWGEGLGYPPLEAMASGTPVVLTDSSGVRDFALPGENCLMVPPADVDAMATAIGQVLDDERLRSMLVAAGYETADRYRWDAAIDRLETALLGLSS